MYISTTTLIITMVGSFIVGIVAGRVAGREVCREKIRTLLENKVLTYDDENNGDC